MADAIADALLEAFDPESSAASTLEVDGVWTVEAYYTEPPDAEIVASALVRAVGPLPHTLDMDIVELAPRDWVRKSLEGLPPVRAGRFVVHGAHDRAFVAPNDIGIAIEAGLAFGTGHHGTTRGCLLALDRILKHGRPGNVLDVGTGTAVLAIAAAKAAHAPAVGVDIDPVAIDVSRENLRKNGVADRVRLAVADGPHRPAVTHAGPFDLVFANILAPPLVRMATSLSRQVAPGGHLILSGLLTWQSRQVEAAYKARGLALDSRLTEDGWRTLILKRSG